MHCLVIFQEFRVMKEKKFFDVAYLNISVLTQFRQIPTKQQCFINSLLQFININKELSVTEFQHNHVLKFISVYIFAWLYSLFFNISFLPYIFYWSHIVRRYLVETLDLSTFKMLVCKCITLPPKFHWPDTLFMTRWKHVKQFCFGASSSVLGAHHSPPPPPPTRP